MGLFNRRKSAEPPKEAVKQIRVRMPFSFPHFLRGDYTLRNSELLFSAISRISNALSAMPIQLYQGTTAKNNELNDILKYAPNSNMTSSNFFKTMEACRCTYGNCYALKVLDSNMKLVRLDVLDPARVTPVLNDEDGELWYKVQPETGATYYINAYYMIHIPFISTNGYTGVNPVSVLFNTLSYADEIQKFSVSQLEKGINAAVVLEAPAQLGTDQRKEMIKSFLDVYKDTGGNILMLESGVQAKALNLSPVDTRLFEVEKITRSKVAMVYNIPPHLLGDYSDSSFSTMEQQMLEFLSLTMLPIVTAYEQEFNKKLLTPEERKRKYHFKFNMDTILRADAKTQAEVNLKELRSGSKSPNDIRTAKGESKIKNGDVYFVSRDLVPLSFMVDNPNLVVNENTGGNKDNEQDTKDDGSQQEIS